MIMVCVMRLIQLLMSELKIVFYNDNVIVNIESLQNAVDLHESYPNISVGIHWYVTTGKPISDTKKSDISGSKWHVLEAWYF